MKVMVGNLPRTILHPIEGLALDLTNELLKLFFDEGGDAFTVSPECCSQLPHPKRLRRVEGGACP